MHGHSEIDLRLEITGFLVLHVFFKNIKNNNNNFIIVIIIFILFVFVVALHFIGGWGFILYLHFIYL